MAPIGRRRSAMNSRRAFRTSKRIRRQRVIHDAQAQTDICRPHGYAACRARFDGGDTAVADDACGRRAAQEIGAEKTANTDGSGSRRQGADIAAQLAAQAAAGSEGLISRPASADCCDRFAVDFHIEIEKIRPCGSEVSGHVLRADDSRECGSTSSPHLRCVPRTRRSTPLFAERHCRRCFASP